MNNTREWIPWVAVITCAIGKYISADILAYIMAICALSIFIFLVRHIRDGMPWIVVWVFGSIILIAIGGVAGVFLNMNNDLKVYLLCVPFIMFFFRVAIFSWKDCRSMSYKMWIGLFSTILIMVIYKSI
ncbi:hypothetical protein SAMN05216584_10273 [Selenomonas sp. WCT3]|uniref:hypothetical protein n=1 Tax=Selenomonas sp. WCT3 TaxID=3158785 RepID=UPI000880997E|nr:hypothetical protein SAMN05216584_10273 [Selenomonas ruminantium]